MLVTLVGSDPLIQFDSDLQPAAVTWNSSGLISFDLSDYAIQAGGYPIQIVAFSPARPDGEVISDFDLSPVAIQFRGDYSSGVTPPPLVQFVPEAPEDGQLYGRRNATWEPIDDDVAGVESVNAKSGVVLLDTDDVPEGATNHYYPQADEDKLAGVEAGATANQTDAYLRDRANHTGTQPSRVANLLALDGWNADDLTFSRNTAGTIVCGTVLAATHCDQAAHLDAATVEGVLELLVQVAVGARQVGQA